MASTLIDKYVKRKRLDPLEAYVPPVILAQLQFQDLEKILSVDKPEFEACRSVLRSGPASSLRVNIRAYASDAGYSQTASNDVDRCLRALEEMDSLFLRASRKDPNATVELMKSQLGTALTALDSLLQTVPSEVLDKGKAMVEVYRSPFEEDNASDSAEIQQLQSILGLFFSLPLRLAVAATKSHFDGVKMNALESKLNYRSLPQRWKKGMMLPLIFPALDLVTAFCHCD
ncbi:BnaA09g40200D [Brassica napus]|uniref:BnaA09g40200D protein n=1 Tax=Brassica napus TaxID=3708 RepID=A0A078FES6_BRANA|nr:BnaA09g40200D [Brassica napus]